MDNIAVIYKCKHGVTKQYAVWIAQELGAIIMEASTVTPSQLASFDIVVYGGCLSAGGIDGVELVTKNLCRSLVVFTVGLANPKTADYSNILKKNFSRDLLSKTKIFNLRGGIEYKKSGLFRRIILFIVRKFRADKKLPEQHVKGDKEFLETHGLIVDRTDKSTIKPLVDYVRSL